MTEFRLRGSHTPDGEASLIARFVRGMFALTLLVAVTLPRQTQAQFAMAERFESSVITNSFGETLPVRVWRHYGKQDLPVPVVVLLHGSGECGRDNAAQLGPFKALYDTALISAEIPPALWLIPQCTQQNPWVRTIAFSPDYRQPRYPAPALRTVKEYLDTLVKDGIADPDRLSIGGYSLGGFGTWDAIQRWPGFFAAAVPVCGGGSVQEEPVRNAAQTAVWAFHGSADTNVPVDCSRRMIAALSKAGAAPKYTEFEGAGHNIWSRAFGDAAVLRWMLRQRRGDAETSSGFFSGGFFGRLKAYVTPD